MQKVTIFSNFLLALLFRFVSKPTLSSTTYRVLEVKMSMSGRRSSPVIRVGKDIVEGRYRKCSDSNIAMMRPSSPVC